MRVGAGIECLPWVEYRLALLGGVRVLDILTSIYTDLHLFAILLLLIDTHLLHIIWVENRPVNIMDVWVFLLLKAQYNTES